MEQRYEDGGSAGGRAEDFAQIRRAARSTLAARYAARPETIGALVDALSGLFSPHDAEPWDRTGLLVGDAAERLEGVACALDPTIDALVRAEELGANVLLTHHPAFLDPPAFIGPRASGASVAGEVVYEAAKRGIALANYHTALDVSAAAQTMLPGLLSLDRVGVLDPLDRDARLGYGQVCRISEGSLTLEALALRCTAVFGRAPRVWGDPGMPVSSAVTWTGSAGPAPDLCLKRGIDVLVCGEVKYHTALDAASAGLALIELGHDVSELPFSAVLAEACAGVGVPRAFITCLAMQGGWFYPESRRA